MANSYDSPILDLAENLTGTSFQDTWLRSVVETLDKGVPSLLIGAIQQTMTGAADIGVAINKGINKLGFNLDESYDKPSTQSLIQRFEDTGAGPSGITRFYTENQDVVDTGAFVAASILPGTAGMKVMNGMRSALFSRTQVGSALSYLAPGTIVEANMAALQAARLNSQVTGGLFKQAFSRNGAGVIGGLALDGALAGIGGDAAVTALLFNTPIWDDKTSGEKVTEYLKDAVTLGAGFNVLFGGITKGLRLKEFSQTIDEARVAGAGITGLAGDVKGSSAKPALATQGDVIVELNSTRERLANLQPQAGGTLDEVRAFQQGNADALATVDTSLVKNLAKLTEESSGITGVDLKKALFDTAATSESIPYIFNRLDKVTRTTVTHVTQGADYPASYLFLKTGEFLKEPPRWVNNLVSATAKVVDDTIQTAGGFKFDNLAALSSKLGKEPVEVSNIANLEAAHYWVDAKVAKDGFPSVIPDTLPWLSKWRTANEGKQGALFNGTLTEEQVARKIAEQQLVVLKQFGNDLDHTEQLRALGISKYDNLGKPEIAVMQYRGTGPQQGKGSRLGDKDITNRMTMLGKFEFDTRLDIEAIQGKQLVNGTLGRDIGKLLPQEEIGHVIQTDYIAKFEGAAGAVNPANPDYNPFTAMVAKLARATSTVQEKIRANISSIFKPASEVVLANEAAKIEVSFIVGWSRAQKGVPGLIELDGGRALLMNDDFMKRAIAAGKNPGEEAINLIQSRPSTYKRSATDEVLTFKSPDTDQWAKAYAKAENSLSDSHAAFNKYNNDYAVGGDFVGKKYGIQSFFVPSINPINEPFVAFVRRESDAAFRDGRTFHITAQDAATLRTKIDDYKSQGYQVVTKGEDKAFKEAAKEYDEALAVNSRTIHSSEDRQGIRVGDFALRNTKQVLGELESYLSNSSSRLGRRATYTGNRDFFDPLELLHGQVQAANKSTQTYSDIGGAAVTTNRAFEAYKQALNVTDPTSTFVGELGTRLSSVANNALTKLRNEFSADKIQNLDSFNFKEFERRTKELGLENAFGASLNDPAFRQTIANSLNARTTDPLFDRFVGVANMFVTRTQLLWDGIQSVVTLLSRPVTEVAEFRALRNQAQKYGTWTPELEDAFRAENVLKNEYANIRDYFPGNKPVAQQFPILRGLPGANSEKSLRKFLEDYGIINPRGAAYAQEVQNSVQAALQAKGLKEGFQILDKAKWLIAKMDAAGGTPENYVQFAAAARMLRVADAAKLSWDDASVLMNTYVQRQQGLYTSSQRPEYFRSSIGSAYGLFQSFQLRMFQRFTEHIEAGDTKAIALMAGMQSTLFGLKTLPGFDYLNRSLIAEHNREKKDIYTGTYDLIEKEKADSLLYGLAGNMLSSSLFTRTDLTPRNYSLIPLNPADIPTISIGAKALGVAADSLKALSNGTNTSGTLLHWLEHNSISRPLGGIAPLFRGYSTSRQGDNLSDEGIASFNMATASRLMGARPFDEAIALDNMYRFKGYQAVDRQKREEIAKSIRFNGQEDSMTPEQIDKWAAAYLRAGGTNNGLREFYMSNLRKASEPMVERFRESIRTNQSRYNFFLDLSSEQ
jgi:hypothetical protein